MTTRRALALLSLLPLTLTLIGCTDYYKVTDPTSGKVYYTTDIDEAKKGGMQFEDAITKSDVTIQNSEVKEISKTEYRAATQKK